MTAPLTPEVAELHDRIHRAVRGDRRAQEDLVARFGVVVRASIRQQLARARLLTESTIEDLSQDTWMALLGPPRPTLSQWQPGGMSLAGYIGQAARWQARMYARSQRAKKRDRGREVDLPPDLAGDSHPETEVAARQESRALAEHLHATLPPRGRLIFQLLYEDGLEITEIAERLNVQRQVVYNWKHRIRTEARAFLESTAPSA